MTADRLKLPALALAALGVAIAGYLTYVHYAGIDPVCTGGGGCERVQTSEWSDLVGIPVALLGLLGYVAIAAVVLVRRDELGRTVAVALAWVGLAFSWYLQYRALHDVDATCIWCLGSAITMSALTAVLTVAYLAAEPDTVPT